MGLTNVKVRPYDGTSSIDVATQTIAANKSALLNIPLLDSGVVGDTFRKQQGYLAYTTFNSLVNDRYRVTGVDGKVTETQAIVSSRDLNLSQVPSQSWEGTHILYTHGYGVALAPANSTTTSGGPNYLIKNVPTQVTRSAIKVQVNTPQVYFSLGQSGYAIVDSSKTAEVDYLNANGSTSSSSYKGAGGVDLNSWVKRAAFALRFGDWNPLISSYVTSGSKILYNRDVATRVAEVAPFLTFDSDPYPVLVDGKIEYVIDGYTTSNHYPNAQKADTTNLDGTRLGNQDFNYIRNSVKAVVDTYNGSVTLYVVDRTDPIIKAYEAAFPKLFDRGAVPLMLKDHFRYPEDIFTVQTNMWGRYHIDDPQAFYGQTAGWSVAQDPGREVVSPAQALTTNQQGQTVVQKEARVDPNYAILKLPGQSQSSFMLFRPFVPFSENDSKKILTSFMVAQSDSDQGDYGQLIVYQIPSDQVVNGPAIVGADISSNKTVSGITTPLNQQGSKVNWGNLVLFPVDNTLVYVRPLYVAAQGGTEVPQIQFVVAAFGSGPNETIVIQPTLQQALQKLFPNAPAHTFDDVGLPQGGSSSPAPPVSVGGSSTTTTTTKPSTTTSTGSGKQTVKQLLDQAAALLTQAQDALKTSCNSGVCDLTTYQKDVNQAALLIAQAQTQENGAATTTTTAPGT